MRSIWTRIENWLADNALEILENLNPGATEEEIERTEEFLGVAFPEDVKDSYRIHNGQKSCFDTLDRQQWDYCLIDYWHLLSLARIKDEWGVWKEILDRGGLGDNYMTLENGEVCECWNPRWIPLTSNFCGDHHCLDLSPSLRGTKGQIIQMWHDIDIRGIVAPSFKAWLETFAEDLEAGHYAYDSTLGQLIDLREETLD
ncbi:MAG TPA: SMI1/KNR4 family protein [Leptolyngbyaceae cyanobacterium]